LVDQGITETESALHPKMPKRGTGAHEIGHPGDIRGPDGLGVTGFVAVEYP